MDRASLRQLLGQGLSLAEIGRRVGLHESTVGYWVQQHGLRAVNREKYAARGGLKREELEPLVAEGMSTAQIAEAVGCGKTTVRHWLREYGLKTQWAERRRGSNAHQPEMVLSCPRHGMTAFKRRSKGGYRCAKCRSEAVARRRRKVKQQLVDDAGGRCSVCGYSRCIAALEFHHLVPADKSFSLSHRGVARSLDKARLEASKCALLCANCHAEVEAGVITLTQQDSARVQCRSAPASTAG
jgi:transposase